MHVLFFRGKVHVCETFCDSMYAECRSAFYDGSMIGKLCPLCVV